MHEKIEFIKKMLPKELLLQQLAEECAELGQAALKMVRVLDGRNPTPVTRPEAFNMIIEEFADVLLCLEVLNMDTQDVCDMMEEIRNQKLYRWEQRLKALDKPVKRRAIYCGFSDHDCCRYFRCPNCDKTFDSYADDFKQKKCISCNTELEF